MIDTLKLAQRLEAAQMPRAQAEALAEGLAASDRDELNPVKQDIAVLKLDVAVLKQDVTILKLDVAVLKQDITVLKEDVGVLKRDVAVLKWMVGFNIALGLAVFVKLFL